MLLTPRARRVVTYVLATALLAIPALILHASLRGRSRLGPVDRLVLRAAAPLQRAASAVIETVSGVWQGYVWLVDVEEENRELRAENERLARELADARSRAREADRLAALSSLRVRLPAETVGARVIAVGLTANYRVGRISVDRGAGEVQVGMPVVAVDGVVGRIARVYGRYADVRLAVDATSSIDVVVERTGARGVLRGLGSDNGYACKVEYVLGSQEVKEGDKVVTSGLGGVFPPDLVVGHVRLVRRDEAALYQEVEVEPAVELLPALPRPRRPRPTAAAGSRGQGAAAARASVLRRAGAVAMRIAAQIALGFVLLVVAGVVWRVVPLEAAAPNLGLIVALYLGLSGRGGAAAVVAGAVLVGYLGDVLGGAPRGLGAFVAGLVALLARLAASRILLRGRIFIGVSSFFVAAAAGLLVVLVRLVYGLPFGHLLDEAAVLLGSAALTGALTPAVFRLARDVNARFARTARERDAIREGHVG